MSILKTMWPFNSPAPSSKTSEAQTGNTPSQPQTPARHALPRPQQHLLTANLEPGTPEARRAAAGLRRRAQHMMARAEEIQSERSNKKVNVSTGLRTTRTSSTSGIQRPSRSHTVSLGARLLSSRTKSRSGGVRTRTAPTATATATRPSGVRARSCRPDIPSFSASIPRITSSTARAQPRSPTDTDALYSSLSDLKKLFESFSRDFFAGKLTVDPKSEKEKARVLCASFFWAKSPETLEFVVSSRDDADGNKDGWQDLWADEDKRKVLVEKVIWHVLKGWVYGNRWAEECEGKERKEGEGEEDPTHAQVADIIWHFTSNGTTLMPNIEHFIQRVLAELVAHITPFLALMHENPYHELHCVLPRLLQITVAAVMLGQRMCMRKDMLDRF